MSSYNNDYESYVCDCSYGSLWGCLPHDIVFCPIMMKLHLSMQYILYYKDFLIDYSVIKLECYSCFRSRTWTEMTSPDRNETDDLSSHSMKYFGLKSGWVANTKMPWPWLAEWCLSHSFSISLIPMLLLLTPNWGCIWKYTLWWKLSVPSHHIVEITFSN